MKIVWSLRNRTPLSPLCSKWEWAWFTTAFLHFYASLEELCQHKNGLTQCELGSLYIRGVGTWDPILQLIACGWTAASGLYQLHNKKHWFVSLGRFITFNAMLPRGWDTRLWLRRHAFSSWLCQCFVGWPWVSHFLPGARFPISKM